MGRHGRPRKRELTEKIKKQKEEHKVKSTEKKVEIKSQRVSKREGIYRIQRGIFYVHF